MSLDREFVRPWLVPEVQDAIYGPERIVMVEGATKTGKTTTCNVWLAEQAMMLGAPGRNFWWVSSVYGTAEIAYRRLKNGLPAGLCKTNDSELALTFPNGAIWRAKSAEKPDNLYGEDVYAAVGDECTRWREQAYHALRTTLTATQGKVRYVYNTKGRGNWAYRLSKQIEQGLPNARFEKFDVYTAVRAGIIPMAEVEAARAELPEGIFNELYLCIPSDDVGNPFGAAIRSCISPLSTAPPVCFGVDLGRAEDYTVVTGLDARGDVCVFDRWFHTPWPETERRINDMTRGVRALVDSTGVGDRVFVALQALGNHYEPYIFTSPSKQRLMEGLAVAIQQDAIGYPDGPIVGELETFEYSYSRTGVRYSAPAGLHDDCVCSLALAVMHHGSRGLFAERDLSAIKTTPLPALFDA